MTVLTAKANAKLNLTLDVVGKRPDGYHDLEMVMQEITLGDDIILTLGTGEPWAVVSESGAVPCDDSNLAVKAARLFFNETGLEPNGLTVEIRKNTPVCAGMGGGSADGAAVLKLLYQHYQKPISEQRLYELAEQVGSDVPFALFGGTALAEEKGQILSRLSSMPRCYLLLCKPSFPISTPELFRAIDNEIVNDRPDTKAMIRCIENGDLNGIAARLSNVFTSVVAKDHPEIREIIKIMVQRGALNASMTGSGPTVFGIFEDVEKAKAAFDLLVTVYPETYLAEPV